jgi:hypothetical protein
LSDSTAAASLEEPHCEYQHGGHAEYGAGALVACGRLVRIF